MSAWHAIEILIYQQSPLWLLAAGYLAGLCVCLVCTGLLFFLLRSHLCGLVAHLEILEQRAGLHL